MQHGRQGFNVQQSPPDTVLRGNERQLSWSNSLFLGRSGGAIWASTSVHKSEASVRSAIILVAGVPRRTLEYSRGRKGRTTVHAHAAMTEIRVEVHT